MRAVDTSITQVGTREAGCNNCGPVVTYLRAVGLGAGYPYCLAGIVWSLDVTRGLRPLPILRTGSTWRLWSWARSNARVAPWRLRRGDILVWNLPGSVSGHAEQVVSSHAAGWVTTIGYNTTKPGRRGSVRDGSTWGGVWRHTRSTLHTLARMRLRGAIAIGLR